MTGSVETSAGPGKSQWKPGQSGNPGGRPKRIGVVRELLELRRKDLVTKAIDLALAGDVGALRLCIERLAPPLKSTSETVVIDGLAEAKTLTEKCEAIVRAVGTGAVSPTVAGELLSAVGSLAKSMETDELARRVAALENGSNK
ncbi:MAG: DUF5681 domain-containing protein [Hydrogenophaga sp.]|nr:DUF5681 domain-containing protein [Hydrogenophaga sp.]